MNVTAVSVREIRPITHREAMVLAGTEYQRLIDAVHRLGPDDWTRPTANELWDVRAMIGHVVGMMKASARVRENLRQQRIAKRVAKQRGGNPIDAMTELEVREHAHLSTSEITRELAETAPRALKGRRRTPAPVRAVRVDPGPPFDEKWKLGYLIDVILTRDTWMHRSDMAEATGDEMVLTADHDGRLVADVVREWARRHGQPFTLVLTGPAGGVYTQDDAESPGGDHIELDAVEFCRILSGRGAGDGLLTTEVPF